MLMIDFWHWWVLAALLFIVEILVPGAFFIWMGLGAIFVGAVQWCALVSHHALSLEMQILLFAVFSFTSSLISRKYLKRHPIRSANNTLNRRGDQYIGRTLTLSEAIINGRGHVRLDDTLWSVTGPDYAKDTVIKIKGVDGALLIVEEIVQAPSI